MNHQEILAIYESVADITDRMLAAARTGDWEQLVELELRCSSQVDILRQNDTPRPELSPADREQKARIIRKILDDDRQIRDITTPWTAQLSAMISSTGTERKLLKTYGASQTG